LQFVHRHILYGRHKTRILFQALPELLNRLFAPARSRKGNPEQVTRPGVRRIPRHSTVEYLDRFRRPSTADQVGGLVSDCRRRLPGER
jgi:hypothetical protein